MKASAQKLSSLIAEAQGGDLVAYDEIVHHFQDMAVAYAYSVLNDRALAEDAAQEALIEAFLCLANLRNPEAFSGWLRRIVFKHCDRLTRRKRVSTISLDDAGKEVSGGDEPHIFAEQKEAAVQVREAIAALPEHERVVTLLFYGSEYSQQHIGDFLEVPVTTVKKRLHTARKKLREMMTPMMTPMQENMTGQNPSQNPQFVQTIAENIAASLAEFAAGDVSEIEIRRHHPNARYRDPHPVSRLANSLLKWALVKGASEIYLVPSGAGLEVRFRIADTTEHVTTLPKSLQESLTARLKDMSCVDVAKHQPQSDSIPLYWEDASTNYDVFASFAPTQNGEAVTLRFVAK